MNRWHSFCSFKHVLLNSRIIGGLAGVVLTLAALQAKFEIRTLTDQVEQKALALAQIEERAAEALLHGGSHQDLQAHVDGFQNREPSTSEAIYDLNGQPVAMNASLAGNFALAPSVVLQAIQDGWRKAQLLEIGGKPVRVLALPLRSQAGIIGAIAIFQDAANFGSVWRHTLASLLVQAVLILIITIFVVRWSLRRPLRRMTQ